MILTLGYRGVFRQVQYETVTVEGSITVDTEKELGGMGTAERRDYMLDQLDELINPLVDRAAQASLYDETDTVLYIWKGFTDAASSTPPARRTQRGVQRGH